MMPDQAIRDVLDTHAKLAVKSATIDDSADLYMYGLTSHASVNVMLALEGAFDVEFPDRLLHKNTFATVGSIRAALAELGVA